jgi:hypothetical protein
MLSAAEFNFAATGCSSAGSWSKISLFIIHLQCNGRTRAQVLQSARDEHFDGGFTFAQHRCRFGETEFAEETQDQRLGAVTAELFKRVQDSSPLEALKR